MGTVINRLTALEIKSLPTGKHFDGGGLYLEKKPDRPGHWFFKYYKPNGKESRLSFGSVTEVTLAEARRRRDEQRALKRDGKDLGALRRESRLAIRQNREAGFRNAAASWLAFKRPSWAAETYRKAEYVVDEYLIPALKRYSITDLTTQQAIKALEMIIAAGAPDLALKARQYLNGIAVHAIRNGLREEGRVLLLRGTVQNRAKSHIPALTDPREIAVLVRAIEAYPTPVTRAALKLLMLTAQRPGNVASAQWAHLDLDAGEWVIPAAEMKMRHDHIVPLPSQALKVLHEMQGYTAGHTYVFPPLARQKSEHLHRDALSKALREQGFEGKHAPHGFRGMFRTVARERLGYDVDILEAQLAHAKKGEVQQAYDRTTFLEERRYVMQKYADYLGVLSTGGNVLPFRQPREVGKSFAL